MRAVLLHEFGGPDRLVDAEIDDPVPDPDQVLIRVAAAGLNFADLLIRRGAYAQPPALPTIVGNEVAGEVVVGDAAGRFAPGDRVAALPIGGGGYAELVAVRADRVFPLPDSVSLVAGGTLLMTYCTAYLALNAQLRVKPGDIVLVHGAGGGVGSATVQLARHAGARVIATASSESRLRLAGELGAELVVDRREQDFVDAVRGFTDGGGADAVVDPLGGDVLERSLAAVRPLGGVVAVGEAAGRWADLPVARVVGRNVSVHGIYLGRLARHAPAALAAAAEAVIALAADGVASPAVGAAYALADAAAAHEHVESGGHAGKVALTAGLLR
jgi:NADPH:quinone reductase-like Zn-dependent oxidoreductase